MDKTAAGSGIGNYRRGDVLTEIRSVASGQLLVNESITYKTTNLAKVTQTFQDKFYAIFVNSENPSEKRQSSDEEFVVYPQDLQRGEWYIALEPSPGAGETPEVQTDDGHTTPVEEVQETPEEDAPTSAKPAGAEATPEAEAKVEDKEKTPAVASKAVTAERSISTTYETWDEESSEIGETDDKGWEDQEGESMEVDKFDEDGVTPVDKAVEFLQGKYVDGPTSSSFQTGVSYVTTQPETGSDYWEKGLQKYYGFHLNGFSEEEEKEIYDRVTGTTASSEVTANEEVYMSDIPQEVIDFVEENMDENKDNAYDELERMNALLKPMGWEFDFDLNGEVFDFKKIAIQSPVKTQEDYGTDVTAAQGADLPVDENTLEALSLSGQKVKVTFSDMEEQTGVIDPSPEGEGWVMHSNNEDITKKNEQPLTGTFNAEAIYTIVEAAVQKQAVNIDDLDEATRAYLEAALWSSTYTAPGEGDIGGQDIEFDSTHSIEDIADESIVSAQKVVKDFMAKAQQLLTDSEEFAESDAVLDDGDLGHDLWLTRNRHGGGFWDRGLGEYGDALTELAQSYGSVDPYLGDDGSIYIDESTTPTEAGEFQEVSEVKEDIVESSIEKAATESEVDLFKENRDQLVGGSAELAAVKELLVDMAVDDTLPMDLNDLDITLLGDDAELATKVKDYLINLAVSDEGTGFPMDLTELDLSPLATQAAFLPGAEAIPTEEPIIEDTPEEEMTSIGAYAMESPTDFPDDADEEGGATLAQEGPSDMKSVLINEARKLVKEENLAEFDKLASKVTAMESDVVENTYEFDTYIPTEEDMDIDLDNDITISYNNQGYAAFTGGKLIAESADLDDMADDIQAWMSSSNYFPNIYLQEERGDITGLTLVKVGGLDDYSSEDIDIEDKKDVYVGGSFASAVISTIEDTSSAGGGLGDNNTAYGLAENHNFSGINEDEAATVASEYITGKAIGSANLDDFMGFAEDAYGVSKDASSDFEEAWHDDDVPKLASLIQKHATRSDFED